MTDDMDRFVDRVKDRAQYSDRKAVRQATSATLRTLGAHLGGVAPALHDAIPRDLHPDLAMGELDEAVRPAELYKQLSERLGIRPGVALELVQSVLAELGVVIGTAGREQLRELLPPAWAALVIEPRPRSRAVRGASPGEPGHTLASGRPGGTRPLAEAEPPTGQADSIAVSDDPHGDRLASTHGPGLDDEEHTLAGGRPGSSHPVADSD